MDAPWHKAVPVIAGFVGAVVMLSYMHTLPARLWASAMLAGVAGSWFIPPIAVSWLEHNGFAWLPSDGSVEGLCGLLVGMAAIHVVGGVAVMGKRFSDDPTKLGKPRRNDVE